jgi:polysaccharide deacetylase 2 family uncharacterized protein YibQ
MAESPAPAASPAPSTETAVAADPVLTDPPPAEPAPPDVAAAEPDGLVPDEAPADDRGEAAQKEVVEEATPAPSLAEPPDAPAADVAIAGPDAGPDAPTESAAPPAQSAPAAPADLAGDAAPAPAEVPAAAPEGIASIAPDAPTAPEPEVAPTGADATDAAPVTPGQPAADLAAAPASDPTPAPAEPPGVAPEGAPEVASDVPAGLPPLTPEEEALLAQIAAEGPGSALPSGKEGPSDAAVAEETPAPTPDPIAEPMPDLASDPAPAPDQTEDAPSLLTETEDDRVIRSGEGSSTLPPTPSLSDSDDGSVTSGRLPKIGAEADAPDGETTEPAVFDSRPIAAFARPFENPDAKPVFAIVLIDDGSDAVDRAALAALPFPVSFALDPTDPRTPDHAAIYRAAGQEVLMLATALPKGGQASDIEVALSAMSTAMPEAVAVMDLPERVFQADRPLATLVVPVVWAGGRGVLTWDQGLNAADQVARRDAVPSAVVFRDLDGADEEAPVIRRYLDRAAFKAAQEGRVTVVGRTRPETVAALLEWAIEGRAATVALAPLTAVLSDGCGRLSAERLAAALFATRLCAFRAAGSAKGLWQGYLAKGKAKEAFSSRNILGFGGTPIAKEEAKACDETKGMRPHGRSSGLQDHRLPRPENRPASCAARCKARDLLTVS